MALYYELAAEFGGHQANAEAFSKHFDQTLLILSDGRTVKLWACKAVQYNEDNWWVGIFVEGATLGGFRPNSDSDGSIPMADFFTSREQLEELTLILYERLKSAPHFRYALVGWEVQEQLSDYADIAEHYVAVGLVVSEEVWAAKGKPDKFVPFCPSYVWIPYNGGIWYPGK